MSADQVSCTCVSLVCPSTNTLVYKCSLMFCTDCWFGLSSVWNHWSKSHSRIHFGGACASSAPLLFLAQAFTVLFFSSTSIVLQSDASSVAAFLRGTKARVLLLTVKETSYLLVLQFLFVLYARSFCPYVSACKPVSCQYGFTRVRPRQIPPF